MKIKAFVTLFCLCLSLLLLPGSHSRWGSTLTVKGTVTTKEILEEKKELIEKSAEETAEKEGEEKSETTTDTRLTDIGKIFENLPEANEIVINEKGDENAGTEENPPSAAGQEEEKLEVPDEKRLEKSNPEKPLEGEKLGESITETTEDFETNPALPEETGETEVETVVKDFVRDDE